MTLKAWFSTTRRSWEWKFHSHNVGIMNIAYIIGFCDVPGRIHLDFHQLTTKGDQKTRARQTSTSWVRGNSLRLYDSDGVLDGAMWTWVLKHKFLALYARRKAMFPSSRVRNLHAQLLLATKNSAFKVIYVRPGFFPWMLLIWPPSSLQILYNLL